MTKIYLLTIFTAATLTSQIIAIPAQSAIEQSPTVQIHIKKGDRSAEIARTTKKNKTERERAAAEIAQIDKQLAQNSERIIATKQTLATNESTLRDIQLVVREGAVARVQLDRQQQQVYILTSQLEELVKERNILLIERKKLLTNTPKYRKRQSDS
jgi:predicted component of type VI protein secretion system